MHMFPLATAEAVAAAIAAANAIRPRIHALLSRRLHLIAVDHRVPRETSGICALSAFVTGLAMRA